jgi:hypothetical protein
VPGRASPGVGFTDVIAIAAGLYHTVALKNDGTVWSWGRNNRGQLGNGTLTDSSTPVQVSGFNVVTYTVTYDLNGGTGTLPAETNKAAGATFTAASSTGITAPAGKQFKEWNTAANGSGTGYAAGATVTMPANALTLYAAWEDVPAAGGKTSGGSDVLIIAVIAIITIAVIGIGAYLFVLRKP